MTLIQDARELGPIAQAAMVNPLVNYRLNLQTSCAVRVEEAWLLFEGIAIIPAIWESGQFYNMRGFPRMLEEGE